MIPVETLRRFKFFAQADGETLKAIAEATREEEFVAQQEVFREGDSATILYILLAGAVELQYDVGGRNVSVDDAAAGDIVGWSSLCEPYRLRATAVAREPGRLLAIDAIRLRELCLANPELGHGLMQQTCRVLSRRLTGALVQLAAVQKV
jgi:CRP-like cAMP-binding protein